MFDKKLAYQDLLTWFKSFWWWCGDCGVMDSDQLILYGQLVCDKFTLLVLIEIVRLDKILALGILILENMFHFL